MTEDIQSGGQAPRLRGDRLAARIRADQLRRQEIRDNPLYKMQDYERAAIVKMPKVTFLERRFGWEPQR